MHKETDTQAAAETLQRPLDRLPDRVFDVVVVGAGPAGSITSIHLAAAGLEVLLVDRDRFPREKVCGDCLLFDAIDALRRADLLDEITRRGHQPPVATIYSPRRYHFDVPGTYWTIKRRTFDAVLAFAAARRGVLFGHAEINEASVDREGIVCLHVTGCDRVIRSRLAVVATGAQVRLAGRTGLVAREEPSAVAVRRYVRSRYPIDRMILSYDRSLIPGYAWIIPLGDGEYNVGCGCQFEKGESYGSLKRVLETFLKEFPESRRLMEQSEEVSRLGGAALRCGLQGARLIDATSRFVAVGETAGATFPFTGEGIGKAMETGELAADAITRALSSRDFSQLEAYPRRVAEELRPRYRGYFFAEKWLSRPWLNDFVSWRIQSSPLLQRRFKDFVSDTGDPRKVFAVATLVRSFFQ
ncbi:MAG: NAD(P)/FAD-dependent oxidoreductase [candidate division Zixibacteria bacterium]|nr:NAD(P)/FAD-dependent oxidoreductase [candidate division Zixibacteria bacterium]